MTRISGPRTPQAPQGPQPLDATQKAQQPEPALGSASAQAPAAPAQTGDGFVAKTTAPASGGKATPMDSAQKEAELFGLFRKKDKRAVDRTDPSTPGSSPEALELEKQCVGYREAATQLYNIEKTSDPSRRGAVIEEFARFLKAIEGAIPKNLPYTFDDQGKLVIQRGKDDKHNAHLDNIERAYNEILTMIRGTAKTGVKIGGDSIEGLDPSYVIARGKGSASGPDRTA
jgi:hypothetical protein